MKDADNMKEERIEWKCKNKKKKFSIMESIRIFLSCAYHSKKSKDKKSNTNRQSKKNGIIIFSSQYQ